MFVFHLLPMKPRDLFGVAVRVVGLCSMLAGVFQILVTLVTMIIMSRGGEGFGYVLLYAGIFIVVGYLLMRGANFVVNLLYPDDDK
jgi:hypothetical protein